MNAATYRSSDEPTRRDEERKRNLLRRKDWRQRLEAQHPAAPDPAAGLWKLEAVILALGLIGVIVAYL
jgi:hypothetical protein